MSKPILFYSLVGNSTGHYVVAVTSYQDNDYYYYARYVNNGRRTSGPARDLKGKFPTAETAEAAKAAIEVVIDSHRQAIADASLVHKQAMEARNEAVKAKIAEYPQVAP